MSKSLVLAFRQLTNVSNDQDVVLAMAMQHFLLDGSEPSYQAYKNNQKFFHSK